MSYSIIPIAKFKREAKRLIKKYPSLSNELAYLNEILMGNPNYGTFLGNETYKIRVAIKTRERGNAVVRGS